MIAEKQTEVLILNDGEEAQSSTKMSLDSDSAHVIMQMLSKNLYSDSIGSAIRETASNGLDSHRRAGVTDVPIIVSLGRNQDDNYEFCVEDFGTGLDANDIENIISKYGKSTKKLEANALGMFGLGFKSPLAYSSSFLFICRKDGIERKYMMYEGDDGNTIDLLYENTTTERNGVKIIIPIKFSDRQSFLFKIKEQLCYFESVYFDVNVDNHIIKDDFVISRGNLLQHSELNTDRNMHICLDNVYYPIDYNKLGIDPINIPIGLRFSLQDGLYPIPNRESLRYTNEAKDIIMKRITEVSDYFIDKYNETIVNTGDVKTVFNHYNSKQKLLVLNFGNSVETFDVGQLTVYSTKTLLAPKLLGISMLNLQRFARNTSLLTKEYKGKYQLIYGKFSELKSYWNTDIDIKDMVSSNYIFEQKLSSVKKAYLRDTVKNSHQGKKFIKKTDPYKLFPEKGAATSSYFQILDLHKFEKSKWRDCIKEFKTLQSMFLGELTNLDDLIIPQTWLDAKKAAGMSIPGTIMPRKAKLQGEVIGKIGVPLLRQVTGKNCKFDPITLKLNEIYKHQLLYVYGSSEDSEMLDKLYLTVENKQKVKVLIFSERELKIIDKLDIHNLMSFKKFMEGKNKIFKRIVTANKIDELIRKYEYVFGNRDSLVGVSQILFDDITALMNYKVANFEYSDEKIITAMDEVASTYNLYDGEMYPQYLSMKTVLERLKFLNPVMRTMSPYLRTNIAGGTEMKEVLSDLLKYYGYKVDINNYSNSISKNTVEQEVINN